MQFTKYPTFSLGKSLWILFVALICFVISPHSRALASRELSAACQIYLAAKRNIASGRATPAEQSFFQAISKDALTHPFPRGIADPYLSFGQSFEKGVIHAKNIELFRQTDFRNKLDLWFQRTYKALESGERQSIRLPDGSSIDMNLWTQAPRGVAHATLHPTIWIYKGKSVVAITYRHNPHEVSLPSKDFDIYFWRDGQNPKASPDSFFIYSVRRKSNDPAVVMRDNTPVLTQNITMPGSQTGWSLQGVVRIAEILDAVDNANLDWLKIAATPKEVDERHQQLLSMYFQKIDLISRYKTLVAARRREIQLKSWLTYKILKWEEIERDLYLSRRALDFLPNLPKDIMRKSKWLVIYSKGVYQLVSIEDLEKNQLSIYLRNHSLTSLPQKIIADNKMNISRMPSIDSHDEMSSVNAFWYALAELQKIPIVKE